MKEMWKRYRPTKLEDVVGQEAAVAQLESFFKKGNVPHSILITGPSGTGKTTIGRILRRKLKCSKTDYHEKDCTTEEKPLDFVRKLGSLSRIHPMGGECIIWFLEEFQSLSRAGFSQQALLKLLEDCSNSVYFLLATTDRDKVLPTIRSRCVEIKLGPVPEEAMKELLNRVATAEKINISKKVINEIAEAADGGARKALVILEQVATETNEAAQLKVIDKTAASKDSAIQLARALMFERKPDWHKVSGLLRDVAGEDAEGLRRLMIGYARSCLIGSAGGNGKIDMWKASKAFMLIDIFGRNFFDSGHAGLAAAAWEACNPE